MHCDRVNGEALVCRRRQCGLGSPRSRACYACNCSVTWLSCIQLLCVSAVPRRLHSSAQESDYLPLNRRHCKFCIYCTAQTKQRNAQCPAAWTPGRSLRLRHFCLGTFSADGCSLKCLSARRLWKSTRVAWDLTASFRGVAGEGPSICTLGTTRSAPLWDGDTPPPFVLCFPLIPITFYFKGLQLGALG